MSGSPETAAGAAAGAAGAGAALGAGAGLAVGVGWHAGPSAPRSVARANRTPGRRVVAKTAINEHENRAGPGGQGWYEMGIPCTLASARSMLDYFNDAASQWEGQSDTALEPRKENTDGHDDHHHRIR